MNALNALSEFVVETAFNDLPSEVVERAKWVLRDSIGVTLGGLTESEVWALADYAVQHEPGGATIFGHGGKVKAGWASLVHGTAGTTLEMDEGHAFARGHAAVHAVSPALALAEEHGASGQETLRSFVLGYEVAARAGVATRLRKPVHPFGAWGVLGAAAIAAMFKGFDAQDIAGTLEVAASYAIAPSFNTAYQGANVRNTYAGMVNKLGLMAADFYALGFRGESGGLDTAFGEILGESFDDTALTDGLGGRYEIMRGYFKPYSGCRYSHAAVDAVLGLMGEAHIAVEQVEHIAVQTYDIAANLNEAQPQTPLAGRFSIPYVVAATLTLGSAGPEAFTKEALGNAQIRHLSARVRVSEDAAFTAMTPAKRPARVVLEFKDGSRREKTVTGSKGDPDQPMTDDDLLAKFHQLANPVIGEQNAARAWETLGLFETLFDMNALTSLLGSTAR
jgi:2-methylcitrate dehydratase PrpD